MRAVLVALELLEVLAERQPSGVSDLSRAMGIPKSTVQRSLGTLHEAGWIRPEGSGGQMRWVLTTRALVVGGSVTEATGLRDETMPIVRELARTTGETVHLTVPDDLWVVLLDKVDSTQPVRTASVLGGRAPIYATSSGKAMLATRPPADVRSLLDGAMTTWTAHTHTDVDELLEELDLIRERGWAVNRGQWRDDVSAVGVALPGPDGEAIGAISISCPTSRLPEGREDDYGALLLAAKARVADRLGVSS